MLLTLLNNLQTQRPLALTAAAEVFKPRQFQDTTSYSQTLAPFLPTLACLFDGSSAALRRKQCAIDWQAPNITLLSAAPQGLLALAISIDGPQRSRPIQDTNVLFWQPPVVAILPFVQSADAQFFGRKTDQDTAIYSENITLSLVSLPPAQIADSAVFRKRTDQDTGQWNVSLALFPAPGTFYPFPLAESVVFRKRTDQDTGYWAENITILLPPPPTPTGLPHEIGMTFNFARFGGTFGT